MYLIGLFFNVFNFTLPFSTQLLFFFFVLGVVFTLSGVASFQQHKTTVNPMNTENVSTLVTSGVYKYTRNPMYVGMLMTLLGYFFYLANPINMLFIALFIWYMNKYQIKPEEVFLSSIFGDEYAVYKESVRRWL
nr:isoprenylcysteine carboxylmethyltransferase family protein [Colwellia sp. D2M02]